MNVGDTVVMDDRTGIVRDLGNESAMLVHFFGAPHAEWVNPARVTRPPAPTSEEARPSGEADAPPAVPVSDGPSDAEAPDTARTGDLSE